MWQLLTPAFVMGLAGSLHCIGMCGPIAMALPLGRKSPAGKATGALLYNLGRVATYSLFGLLFGSIGKALPWFGWQQRFSVALGIAILLHLAVPRVFPALATQPRVAGIMSDLRQRLGKVLFKGGRGSLFASGLMNGLLPCGLVYMALTGAAVTGDSLQGMAFMAFFGLGTLPMMLATSLLGHWMAQPARTRLLRLYPAILMFMATLLILRGLNLGIPGLSPSLNHTPSHGMTCQPD